jgi:hypothetical protein
MSAGFREKIMLHQEAKAFPGAVDPVRRRTCGNAKFHRVNAGAASAFHGFARGTPSAAHVSVCIDSSQSAPR